jgi:hypothetical protein
MKFIAVPLDDIAASVLKIILYIMWKYDIFLPGLVVYITTCLLPFYWKVCQIALYYSHPVCQLLRKERIKVLCAFCPGKRWFYSTY